MDIDFGNVVRLTAPDWWHSLNTWPLLQPIWELEKARVDTIWEAAGNPTHLHVVLALPETEADTPQHLERHICVLADNPLMKRLKLHRRNVSRPFEPVMLSPMVLNKAGYAAMLKPGKKKKGMPAEPSPLRRPAISSHSRMSASVCDEVQYETLRLVFRESALGQIQ
jgi:hypothetical protein